MSDIEDNLIKVSTYLFILEIVSIECTNSFNKQIYSQTVECFVMVISVSVRESQTCMCCCLKVTVIEGRTYPIVNFNLEYLEIN